MSARDNQQQRRNRKIPTRAAWRDWLYQIIFEADTFGGQLFDILLLVMILLSILTVCLETVETFQRGIWPTVLYRVEWTLTIMFTIEYIARLACVEKPLRYAFSFFGVIDLLACLPMYLTLFRLESSSSLMIVRSFRLLRAFRVMKMMRMLKEAHILQDAVVRSKDKILVFIAVVLVAVTISGTLIYQVEHETNGDEFASIPDGMYWAIVTMATVGYGDIKAETAAGKFISSVVILLGYSLIIVPTGVVSAELSSHNHPRDLNARACPHCFREGHSYDAAFCDMCGEHLIAQPPELSSEPENS